MKLLLSSCAALALAATTTMAAPSHQRHHQLGLTVMQRQLLAETNLVHAVDMAAGGWIGSTGTGGTTPTTRAVAQKFNSTMVAEIVGAGYTDASVALKEWMASPAYSIYVLGDFKYMGAGYAMNAAQTYKSFWVLDFDKNAVGEMCA